MATKHLVQESINYHKNIYVLVYYDIGYYNIDFVKNKMVECLFAM